MEITTNVARYMLRQYIIYACVLCNSNIMPVSGYLLQLTKTSIYAITRKCEIPTNDNRINMGFLDITEITNKVHRPRISTSRITIPGPVDT